MTIISKTSREKSLSAAERGGFERADREALMEGSWAQHATDIPRRDTVRTTRARIFGGITRDIDHPTNVK